MKRAEGVLREGATDSDPHRFLAARRLTDMAGDENSRDPRAGIRTEIREFLSSRRARITPEQAGLPSYGGDRRRVVGLRREEVALLAGVSPQYYVRLGRGDAAGVSSGVIDSIAHALRLDDAERAHLLDLIRTASTPRQARRRRPPSPAPVRPTIQRILDSMHLTPAVVLNGRLDIVTANSLGRALFAPVYTNPETISNNARFVFLDPQAKTFFRQWETVANDTVAMLRTEAGRVPYDRDLSDLVGQLATRSDDFRGRWAAHNVRIHSTGMKFLHHPVVGDLDLPFESLPLAHGSIRSLVVYTAEPGSASHDALAVLASWEASAPPEAMPAPAEGTETRQSATNPADR